MSLILASRRAALLAGLALLAACETDVPSAATQRAPFIQDASDVVFLTQNAKPTAVMQALHIGKVAPDAAGCIRLDAGGPDASTVIWPVGFSVRLEESNLLIIHSNGRVVGAIGDSVRLGGGHVPELHEGIQISQADRERAVSRCPGSYWIVGDVP